MSYDPNVDYKKLMEEAVARGDLTQAALYEEKRNEKIQGQALSQYTQTTDYAKYLPQIFLAFLGFAFAPKNFRKSYSLGLDISK